MKSRAKDFQIPVHAQPMATARGEGASVRIEKLCEKETKSPTIRTSNKKRRQWRNRINNLSGHFCIDCWAGSRRSVRMHRWNAITSVKKKPNKNFTISSDQGTTDSFIDNIFSLIK